MFKILKYIGKHKAKAEKQLIKSEKVNKKLCKIIEKLEAK